MYSPMFRKGKQCCQPFEVAGRIKKAVSLLLVCGGGGGGGGLESRVGQAILVGYVAEGAINGSQLPSEPTLLDKDKIT